MEKGKINLEDCVLRKDANLLKIRKDICNWFKDWYFTTKPEKAVFENISTSGSFEINAEDSEPNYLRALKQIQKFRELGYEELLICNWSFAHIRPDMICNQLVFNFGESHNRIGDPIQIIELNDRQQSELYAILKPYIVKQTKVKNES